MNLFLWNLFLAFIWTTMSGNLTLGNLLVGFGIGYVILLLVQRILGPSPYFSRVYAVMRFVGFFFWELFLANLRVAHDVITPTHYARPGVIAIPLEACTDVEITLLANLISLTPGSLSLDVADDCRTLYVHAMYVDDPETFRQHIKQGMERRLLEVLR